MSLKRGSEKREKISKRTQESERAKGKGQRVCIGGPKTIRDVTGHMHNIKSDLHSNRRILQYTIQGNTGSAG